MTILSLFPIAHLPTIGGQLPANPLFTPTSALKSEFTASFNGFTYCPFDQTEIALATSHLLNFATERYLWDGYDSFVLNVLADYPEFRLDTFDPLDSAMLTAYSEGFLHKNFKNLLAVIRHQHQTHLDYTNLRLLTLLETLYEWSKTHAAQFSDTCQEVFTCHMLSSPASPLYAFILICAELDLPLDRWVSREKTIFRKAFGYEFTGKAAQLDSMLLAATSLESEAI